MVVPKRRNEKELLANYTVVLTFTMYNIIYFDQLPIQTQGLIIKPQPILHSMWHSLHIKRHFSFNFKKSHIHDVHAIWWKG
jgi:hypothetical protein